MPHTTTLQLLQDLISFDTTSCNSNLELMAYVQSYLNEQGVESQLIYDEAGGKANLYATVAGAAENKQQVAATAGIMLSGHTDTVPVTGQNWTCDPYQLSETNGRYYGRGTSDMKTFIASALAAVPAMQAANLQLPVHLAFSYDEEIGCVGVRRMIDTLKDHPVKPAVCIIGEPTEMQVVTAHKGKLAAKVSVYGKECHSGMAPYGVNAVNYAARMITWLEQLAQEKKTLGPFEDGYDIPYTTVHTGVVHGGTVVNIVPNYCEFIFEFRNVAAEDPRGLLQRLQGYADKLAEEMRTVSPDCHIEINITTEYPGLSTASDSEVIAFVKNLAQPLAKKHINFGTEGGLFSKVLGIPTVVCGPGSMDQGHKPDEFIHIDQINQCDAFMARLITQLSA